MVKIIYMHEITDSNVDAVDYDSISDFLIENFSTRDQLLDLRFFRDELLGEEINQAGGDFIDIDDGTVVVVHDSQIPKGPETWVYLVIAVVVGVAAALALKPELPELGNSQQQSATNRLGDTTNEPRINQRIDDIFGKLKKHVVSLWQVPYRIGVNNQEVEVLYTCVGRGKYAISESEWYDGDTPVKNIPNASVSVYGPNTSPSLGVPELQIGPAITEPIGIYRQSNDLNPSELVPPNEDENSRIVWKATASTTIVDLTATEVPSGFVLTDAYTVGDLIKVRNLYHTVQTGTKRLYFSNEPTPSILVPIFTTPVDLSEAGSLDYEVLAVTSTTLQLAIPAIASTAVKNAWDAMTDYFFPKNMYRIQSEMPSDEWTTNSSVVTYNYWEKDVDDIYYPISATAFYYPYTIGVGSDGAIGPIFLPEGAEEVLMNFVSPSGFYKLVENNEVDVYTPISIVFREVDIDGIPTGAFTTSGTGYGSNPDGKRRSVFHSVRQAIPYSRCTIECRRVGDRDKSEGVSTNDIVEWRDLYTFQSVTVSDFGDVTTAHILIPSNSQSRLVKQRKQNVTLTRKITQYLGAGAFGPAESYPTESFDQILIHTALDPYIGRLSLTDINADGFLDLKEEIETYFGSDVMTKFGYDFDSTSATFQDTFMSICSAVMCIPYTQFGVYDAFFEKVQPTSSMQITCRNKLYGTETRSISYDRKFDGVEVTYRSNVTGTSDTVYIPQDQSARNPERITLNGCTTELQAFRYACRVYNRQKYQTTTVKFEVDEFGRNVIAGRRIDSPDSTRFTVLPSNTDGYRVFDGEVVEVDGLNVELSEPVVFTVGEDHYITFTKADGTSVAPVLCTQVDDYTVTLATLPAMAIYDGYEQDRTKYVLVSEQLQQSVALLPKTIEFSLSDEGSEVHTITSVNYTDKYYQNDLDEPE